MSEGGGGGGGGGAGPGGLGVTGEAIFSGPENLKAFFSLAKNFPKQ